MIKRQQRDRRNEYLRNKERRINKHHNKVLKANERQTDKQTNRQEDR